MFKLIFTNLLETLSPSQICWICLLATIGLAVWSGQSFASKGEFRDYALVELEERIIENRIRQCQADNDLAWQYFEERIQVKQRQYEGLKNTRFAVPACGKL